MENEEYYFWDEVCDHQGKALAYEIWKEKYKEPIIKNPCADNLLNKFKIGDKVRHKDSGREYYVIPKSEAKKPSYTAHQTAVRPIENDDTTEGWMVVTKNLELVEEEEDMTQLYQFTVDDEIKFGTKLAVNSAGEWVMEEKGSNNVIAVKKELVEEVIPYSVDIQFQDNTSYNYSYTSVEGKFEVNDLLLMESQKGGFSLAVVKAVNTKSKAATKELKPIAKLLTQPVD